MVMVQGFGTGPRAMRPVARFLSRRGLACAVAPLGGMLGYLQTRRVTTAARRLNRYLGSLDSRRSPWIIGHSIGGIVARYAIQQLDAGDRVAGVITLGTPHQGSPAAVLGLAVGLGVISTSLMQIVPGAPIIRRLNREPWPSKLPLYSIVSTGDLLCRPRSGQLPFADGQLVRNLEVSKLGHTEMMRTTSVLETVNSLITNHSHSSGGRQQG